MRLATLRLSDSPGDTVAVRVDGDTLVALDAPDVGSLLATEGALEAAGSAAATAPKHPAAGATYATLVPRPSKVLCVGLNYKNHILEMGRGLPEHPTLFAKFADALIGAGDDILRPPETDQLDWEVELGVVIGQQVRRADEATAARAIAGFTVLNDITCRDWQFRTREWLQGKSWDSTTPVGPWLTTPDELPGGVRPRLRVRCEVDGQVLQEDTTSDLLFDPVTLVRYSSTIMRLNPGDIIATGTPGGVGHARTPPMYLTAGQIVVTEGDGLGRMVNRVVDDPTAR